MIVKRNGLLYLGGRYRRFLIARAKLRTPSPTTCRFRPVMRFSHFPVPGQKSNFKPPTTMTRRAPSGVELMGMSFLTKTFAEERRLSARRDRAQTSAGFRADY